MACLPSLIGMRGRCAVVEEQDCWLLVVTQGPHLPVELVHVIFCSSSFFQTENKRRALSRAPTAVTRGNPRQLQRVRCSACSRLQC